MPKSSKESITPYPTFLFQAVEASSKQPQIFPVPGALKTRNPRSDKVESELRIEVLRDEKERHQVAIELAKLEQRQASEKPFVL